MSTNIEETLIKGIMRHGPDILEKCLVDPEEIKQYLSLINHECLDYPVPLFEINSNNWSIPKEYKLLDIEQWLIDQCPKEIAYYDRFVQEIELYKKHNFIPVLQAMKYIVDTLRENNVVWGVGRGSSVASYVLFLLGVHKIDSVKYKLPIEEFFKGDQNG